MSDYDGVQVCSIMAQVNPGEGVCSDWRGRRTDRSVTFVISDKLNTQQKCAVDIWSVGEVAL